jgi:hypothetical protein
LNILSWLVVVLVAVALVTVEVEVAQAAYLLGLLVLLPALSCG